MIVICEGDRDGKCVKMDCTHKGEHVHTNDCNIGCKIWVDGESIRFGRCKQDTKIIDVDDLFKDIEI